MMGVRGQSSFIEEQSFYASNLRLSEHLGISTIGSIPVLAISSSCSFAPYMMHFCCSKDGFTVAYLAVWGQRPKRP